MPLRSALVVIALSLGAAITTGCGYERGDAGRTTAAPRGGEGGAYVLLATNRVVHLSNAGKILRTSAVLGPHAPPGSLPGGFSETFFGRRMAWTADRARLIVLASSERARDTLFDLNPATLQREKRHVLASWADYSSVQVGPVTGDRYLFGRVIHPEPGAPPRGTPIVTVMSAHPGNAPRTFAFRKPRGGDWEIYRGLVTADEAHVAVSYHGGRTTGVDWAARRGRNLVPCVAGTDQRSGCVRVHGNVADLGNDQLLAATGDQTLIQVNLAGSVARSFDTKLAGNHLMEFTLTADKRAAYAVGPCGYAGGLARIDLVTGRVATLWQRPRHMCGARIAVDAAGRLFVTRTRRVVPDPTRGGGVLLVDGSDGRVLGTLTTSAEPIDVLAS